MMLLRLLLLLLILVSPAWTRAATLTATPATLATVLHQLQPGDTLQLADGTYHRSLSNVIPSGRSASQPTIVRAAPGAHPLFTGARFLLEVNNRQHIVVDGLTFQNAYIGVRIGNGSSYITVQNSVIRGMQGNCIGDHPGHNVNHHIVYRNNYIGQCGIAGDTGHGIPHGIYFNLRDSIIENNVIEDARTGQCIKQQKDRQDWLSNNIIRGNVIRNCALAGVFATNGSGTQITDNLIQNAGKNGVFINLRNARGIVVARNVIMDSTGACVNVDEGVGHQVSDNLCWGNTEDGVRVDPTESSGVRVQGTRVFDPGIRVGPGGRITVFPGSRLAAAGFQVPQQAGPGGLPPGSLPPPQAPAVPAETPPAQHPPVPPLPPLPVVLG